MEFLNTIEEESAFLAFWNEFVIESGGLFQALQQLSIFMIEWEEED